MIKQFVTPFTLKANATTLTKSAQYNFMYGVRMTFE